MPWCVVVGCNNNTFKKNRDKDVSFFRIPKDGSLKRRWVQNIKRENLPKDPKICHLHFEESCFKRDLQVSFILIRTYYPANKLRNNYVIFSHFLVTNKRN